MRQVASVLLLLVVAIPMGAKWKTKDKRFDPVTIRDVRTAAGRYVGIETDYVVRLDVDGHGTLTGKLTQFGVTYALRELRISGAELNASIGGLPIHGTFVTRTRDGSRTFGLLVHDADVSIDDVTLSEMFCRKS